MIMASITERKLKIILDEKFDAQAACLDERFKRYEEARQQTWKNADDILVIKTEKKTIKWGLVALYSLIGAVIQVIGLLIALEIISK
jgi:hypothetical protein